ncbi:cAMP-responsive element modulator-like isoform X1 [Solea solea]|uniref:cAMP-responsive element modulator-like isoform X1 n=2 Tax=Solea solea TaxID=90069 RepID=UPI00272CFEA3|nr:cAMP-responsive element modulator-like isoform X1 [Solea solea]
MNQPKPEGQRQSVITAPVDQQSHSRQFGLQQFVPEGAGVYMTIPNQQVPQPPPGGHFQPLPGQAWNWLPPTPQSTLNVPVYIGDTRVGPQMNAPGGDFTAYQLQKPSSSLPQGVAGNAIAHSSKKSTVDDVQRREFRLMKNRMAARECRRKKREHLKYLEDRLAVLENQNKTLIEELRVLKDMCQQKAE